jgi:creatinine amidohydrolase
MNWPTYRNRYLPAMSSSQICQLAQKERALVILPTGAVEQHGPHLPVGVDALLGQAYLDRALPKLKPDAPVYVLPPIQVGKSNEHTGFPGTLIIHRESLRQLILSAGRQITAWGFKRIAILNTHGGNISVIKSVLRELYIDMGIEPHILTFAYKIDISEREATFGIHANELESSLMYAITPDMVAPENATCCWIGKVGDAKQLQCEFAPATYAWKTLDISCSGTMGDATIATSEKGHQWIEASVRSLVEKLTEMLGDQ